VFIVSPLWAGSFELVRRRAVRDGMEGATSPGVSEDPRLPGVLLGIGLGGFVDGIVFHQILQWHHMLSSDEDYSTATVGGLETNTLADGLFHAATWVVVVVGIWTLWRRTSEWRWAINGWVLCGWILFGFGLFNVLEGVINHQLLGLHHVRDDLGGPLDWDIGFLVASAIVMLGGWLVTRRAAGTSSSDGWSRISGS
jgi:uncharacterized membrane protein